MEGMDPNVLQEMMKMFTKGGEGGPDLMGNNKNSQNM